MKSGQNRRIILFVVVSLLLHVLTFFVYHQLPQPALNVAQSSEWVEVELLPKKKLQQQLVDVPAPETEQAPDNARFLGQYNSKVQEEQRRQKPSPVDVNPSQKEKVSARDFTRKQKKEDSSQKRLAELYAGDLLKQQEKRENKALDHTSAFNITPKMLDQYTSLSKDDFVWDVKFGSQTFVNVQKFEHFPYFIRLKRKFRIAWNPLPSLRSLQVVGRQLNGDQITVGIGFIIRPDGSLGESYVINPSGIRGYDAEAIRTIRASAPFAIPPEAIYSSHGVAKLYWEFRVVRR